MTGECPGVTGRWTCRASALRIQDNELIAALADLGLLENPFEPFVANEDGDPCEADGGDDIFDTFPETDDALIDQELGGEAPAPGSLRVRVLYAETEDDPGATARSGVANVVIMQGVGPTATELLAVEVLTSEATGRCEGGTPVLAGDSNVVSLRVMGETTPLDDPGDEVEIPLGPIGTLWINEEVEGTTPDGGTFLTRRALHLDTDTPAGDVIIAESTVDVHGDPCP